MSCKHLRFISSYLLNLYILHREKLRAKVEASMDPEKYTPINSLDDLLSNTALVTMKKTSEVSSLLVVEEAYYMLKTIAPETSMMIIYFNVILCNECIFLDEEEGGGRGIECLYIRTRHYTTGTFVV